MTARARFFMSSPYASRPCRAYASTLAPGSIAFPAQLGVGRAMSDDQNTVFVAGNQVPAVRRESQRPHCRQMLLVRRAHLLGRPVPELDGLVARPGDELLAIGGESH